MKQGTIPRRLVNRPTLSRDFEAGGTDLHDVAVEVAQTEPSFLVSSFPQVFQDGSYPVHVLDILACAGHEGVPPFRLQNNAALGPVPEQPSTDLSNNIRDTSK